MSYVSAGNSTRTPLAAGAAFTVEDRHAEDVLQAQRVDVTVGSDQPGVVYLEFAHEQAGPYDISTARHVIPGRSVVVQLARQARWFKVRYCNKGQAQAHLRLQTIIHAEQEPAMAETSFCSDQGMDEIDVCSSPIALQGLTLSNVSEEPVHFKLYDGACANPSNALSVLQYHLPANSVLAVPFGGRGVRFQKGCYVRATLYGGSDDTTEPAGRASWTATFVRCR